MFTSIVVLLITLPILYLTFKYQKKAEAAWMNDNWLYRTSLTIGNTGAADTNKKVKFDIDTATLYSAGKIQIDCGDSRFTDINGKILKYYIDTAGGACNTNSTDYYVLIPTIFSGNTVIYHYYGNPSAVNGTQSSQFSESTFTPTSGPSAGSEENSPGPIAYWKLDEGYGNSSYDSSTNNLNLTRTNATWQNEEQCVSGKCTYYDGTGDYFSVNDNDKLDLGTGPFTISAWVKLNDTSTYREIVSKGNALCDACTEGYSLWWMSNAFRFSVNGSTAAGDIDTVASSAVYSDTGKWYHIVGLRDGSNLKIYVNGVLSNQATDNQRSANSSATTVYLGGPSGWKGFIDEVKIYKYARSAAQVKSDFTTRGSGAIKGTSASLGSSNQNLASLNDGLVGYWKMDEATWSGTLSEVVDSSGNAIHGQSGGATGGKAYPTKGKFGNGGYFDGVDDYITLGDSSTLQPTNISVSAWFKTTATGSQKIIRKRTYGYGLEIGSTSVGIVRFWINDSSATQYNATSTSTYNDGNWHYATGTYNGNTVKLFIDGAQVDSQTAGTIYYAAGAVAIGRDGDSSNSYFSGQIDELRVYNRALTSAEVRQLYSFAPGPINYWSFNERSGSLAYDTGSAAKNGTLSGASWSNGKYGSGIKFSSATQYVQANPALGNIGTSNFTIELFAKEENQMSTNTMPILYRQSDTDGSPLVNIQRDRRSASNHDYITFSIRDSSGNTDSVSCGKVSGVGTALGWTNDGKWHHVAAIRDTSALKLFIDGKLCNTGTNTPRTVDISSYNTYIGNGYDTGTGLYDQAFDGTLDEVKIFNYARTSGQVIENMNADHPLVGSPVGSAVAHYKFDEGYGNTLNNSGSGGSSLNLTNSGATWNNNGKYGKTLLFNGNGNYASISDDNSLDARTDPLTVSFWINAAPTASIHDFIIRKGTGGSTDIGYAVLVSNSSGKARVYVNDGSSYIVNALTGNITIADQTWHYVTFVWDPTVGAKIYVDGKLDTQTSVTTTVDINSSASFYVGGSSASYTVDGLIDEVKLYHAALTEDQIKQDMNHGAAIVLGSTSIDNIGSASNSATASYCPPGNTETNCAAGSNPAPVGEWKMDEKTSTYANDTSGNGLQGTFSGSPTWKSASECKKGACLSFNGSTDHVNIPVTNTSSSRTRIAWIYPTYTGTTIRGIVSNADWVTGSIHFKVYNGNIMSQILDGGSNPSLTSAYSINTWYHVANTYDGSTGDFKLYVNGRLVSSATAVSGLTMQAEDFIGNEYDAARYFQGRIDDVKIFNYPLSPAQVAWDYNRDSPVGWWKMDECTGETLYDLSGNSNNGTWYGTGGGTQTSVGTCTTSGTAWYNGSTGKFNSSLNFDGNDDNIQVTDPSNGSLDFGTLDFSTSAWIKSSYSSGVQYYIQKGATSTSTDGYSSYIETTGAITSRICDGGGLAGSRPTVTSTKTGLNDGNWHHVITVYSRQNNAAYIYIDGKYDASASISSISGNSIDSSADFEISRNDGTPMNGQIDDVRIYNYALSAAQIKSLYNESSAVRFGPSSGSP